MADSDTDIESNLAGDEPTELKDTDVEGEEEEEEEVNDDNELLGIDKTLMANKPTDKEQKRYKYGIIYLSYIPDGLTVKMLRDIMNQYGEVGRIYLEPDENNPTTKMKKYIEGWIEFKKKRHAKAVAKRLNGATLQYGKKHSRISGQIWSIKYLHKFKWAHLTEQMAHDRATRDQKKRFEMSQTKKQVDFYQKMTERSKIMRNRRNRKNNDDGVMNPQESKRIESLKSKQNKPIQHGNELSVQVDDDLLSSIFKKVS